MLEVGRVVKAHGIKGEVIVELVTDRTERVAPGSALQAGDRRFEVRESTPHQGRWIVQFAGVSDRNAAERLRGVALSAEPLADPDALWVHELIGSEVVDLVGSALGRVTSVEANPASDLLVLDGGGLVPLRFVTDHQPGRITVDVPDGLFDL
jgi:16S rRNA processing protein RimM